MMAWVILILGTLAIAALWDVGRRAVDAHEKHDKLLERFKTLEHEVEKLHGQVQAVLGRLAATQAAQNTRLPRSIGRT